MIWDILYLLEILFIICTAIKYVTLFICPAFLLLEIQIDLKTVAILSILCFNYLDYQFSLFRLSEHCDNVIFQKLLLLPIYVNYLKKFFFFLLFLCSPKILFLTYLIFQVIIVKKKKSSLFSFLYILPIYIYILFECIYMTPGHPTLTEFPICHIQYIRTACYYQHFLCVNKILLRRKMNLRNKI